MKRFFLFALVAMMFTACATDTTQDLTPQTPETLTVSFEEQSRIQLNSEGKTVWTKGDLVSVFYLTDANQKWQFQGETGARVGNLTRISEGEATVTMPKVVVVYPYNESYYINIETCNVRAFLPAEQHYLADSYGLDGNILISSSEYNQFSLKNVCGWLKLQLSGDGEVIKSIKLKGNSGEQVAGELYINAVDATAALASDMGSADDEENGAGGNLVFDNTILTEVALNCGEGVTLGEESTSFYLALPPMTFEKGFTITITNAAGISYEKSTQNRVTIERNTILPMANFLIGDEKVRVYLSEKANATRTATTIPARDWSESSVEIDGEIYSVRLTPENEPYVNVPAKKLNSGMAVLYASNSDMRYDTTPFEGVKMPYSQFQNNSKATIASFPMYAKSTSGNQLVFNDGFALLQLRLKGASAGVEIVSVKVDNLAEGALAGISNVDENGAFDVTNGMDFAVLNCTNYGEFTPLSTSTATDFYVMVAPGSYPNGLKVSVCDSKHTAMFYTTPAIELQAGQVYTINKTYTVDSDLVYYEGFDNFVWGGDIMKGSEKGSGFAPDATNVTYTNCLDRSGYQEAFTSVPYDMSGTGFIQPNVWADVNGKTVGAANQMTESYIQSRNIADYIFLYRAQERPGYISLGAGGFDNRGVLQLPMLANMDGVGNVKIAVKFALHAGYNVTAGLEVDIFTGGNIVEAHLNGTQLSTSMLSHDKDKSKLVIPLSALNIVPSDVTAPKEWSTLELLVEGATNGTSLKMMNATTASGVHGVYVDSIDIRKDESWTRSANTLRVLMWNIQNGMWADQHNNYNNFVAWVQKYDPDICIWCESETIYNDLTNTSMTSSRYLPNGWSSLCKRYGHSYASTGGNRDNYSQSVTSKYPITTISKITGPSDKPISHGAGHFAITVNGKTVNIVSLHTWPQTYGYGVSGTSNQSTSTSKNEGDYYREYEMQYLVDYMVYAGYNDADLWLMGGDTNSLSRKDSWFYSSSTSATQYLPHDVVLDQTNMKDVIADRVPAKHFMPTTESGKRIDIMYASPAMFGRIEHSITLIDAWASTLPEHSATQTNWSGQKFRDPSDHRPLLIDFNMQ